MTWCHVCGDRTASVDGYTRDNRVILTCGDAVEPSKTAPWNRRARLHPECRAAYKSDMAHGIVYPAVETRLAILNVECLYCRQSLFGQPVDTRH